MTVATNESGAVEQYEETGLEDFAPTDIVIPRIKILHKEALFHDNLSGNDYTKLRVAFLGLVKQRILWHPSLEDEESPMCKSPNYTHGFPLQIESAPKQPKNKFFPWALAELNEADYPKDEEGRQVVQCSDCKLKEWGTNPINGKNPYCNEQFTMPMMFQANENDDNLVPALITFSKTGIKNSKQYISEYARSQTPLYTAFTELGLEQHLKGSNPYCIPTFKKLEATPRDRWPEFAKNYRNIRTFISAWPTARRDDDGTEASVKVESNEWSDPVAPAAAQEPVAAPVAAATPPPAPAPAPTPPPAPATVAAPVAPAASTEEVSDLPF